MKAARFAIAVAALVPIAALAQQAGPDKATWITKEEIETVAKAIPNGDRNIKVANIGHENFAVGIVHRGKTVNGSAGGPAIKLPPGKPCGRKLDTLPATGGTPAGITHDSQTEGYYIVSGGGTTFTDGYIANGTKIDMTDLNGPTCFGTAYGVTRKVVKEGDVIIIPAGVVHGWLDIPDHVDYLSFRPSTGILTPGWVSPALKK